MVWVSYILPSNIKQVNKVAAIGERLMSNDKSKEFFITNNHFPGTARNRGKGQSDPGNSFLKFF